MRIARESGLPFELHIQQHETPNEGVIQMIAARTRTGAVDRKYGVDFSEEAFIDTPVEERGGELVASQSATGHIHFIAHPRTSDRLKANKPDLILLGPLDPADVTVRLIRKALRRYLLVLQSSSIIGSEDALTLRERLIVLWIHFRELRNRYDLYRSLLSMRNEWAKLLITLAFGLFVGYVTGSKT